MNVKLLVVFLGVISGVIGTMYAFTKPDENLSASQQSVSAAQTQAVETKAESIMTQQTQQVQSTQQVQQSQAPQQPEPTLQPQQQAQPQSQILNQSQQSEPAPSSSAIKPAESTKSDRDLAEPFILEKNNYNRQIQALAVDVNAYLDKHKNYRNASNLIAQARSLVNNIRSTRNDLQQIRFKDDALKNQILRVIDAEFVRADGIREGLESSRDGGDWKAGFSRGHDGKLKFDSENAALTRMMK